MATLLLCINVQSVVACIATTQYPTSTFNANTNTLSQQQITNCNYSGEYAVVIIPGSYTWTFSSGVSTDILTITDLSNDTLAQGMGQVDYTSVGGDTVRMHVFYDSTCTSNSSCRFTYVSRGPCFASTASPASAVNASATINQSVTINNCAYSGTYATVNIPVQGTWEFSSSDTTDVVVISTANDSLLTYGTGAVNYASNGSEIVRMHIWADASCTADTTCRNTYVERIICSASTQFPTTLFVADSSELQPQTITSCNWGGEYAVVYISGGFTWTFNSSVGTDFFVLKDGNDSVVASGIVPISYYPATSDTFTMHVFSNAGCGEQNTCRTTTLQRNPCLATNQFPLSTVYASTQYGDTVVTSSCGYTGQYALIDLPIASDWYFASSTATDLLALTDISDNLIMAGTGSLNYSSLGNEQVKLHMYADNFCAVDSNCRTPYVLRLPCAGIEEYPLGGVATSYDPAEDQVSTCNWAGDYFYLTVDSGMTYSLRSDSSDYFIVTDTSLGYISSGWTPETFTNPYADTTLMVHIFTDTNCGEESVCRNTYVRCTTCPVPVPTISSSATLYCQGSGAVTLTANNPFSGTVYWYEGSCGSVPIDSGISIQVNPTGNTTYYAANSYETILSECDSFTLPFFIAPIITQLSNVSVACFGDTTGSVELQASGGISPYVYAWSNGSSGAQVSGLSAGNYLVSVTDSIGCETIDTVSIDQNPEIITSTDSMAEPLCHGDATGFIALTVSGGVQPFNYAWSNGANTGTVTNVSAGTYDVTITDSLGCESLYSVLLTEPEAIESAFSINDAFCEGDSNGSASVIIAGGIAPYQLLWFDGSTADSIGGLSSGSYSLTILDSNACELVDSAVIGHLHDAPVIPLDDTTILCQGDTISLEAGSGASNYAWSTGDSSASILVDSAGTFSVLVTSAFGCTSEATTIVVEDPCIGGLASISETTLTLFPNPTRDKVIVEVRDAGFDLTGMQLYNATGQIVWDHATTD
ncbi:MAG: SprB repeat-containing protein [Flavobacteriales bacterium]|nr:SprB repeat-containing protein [Flavobacteriales bacterium]